MHTSIEALYDNPGVDPRHRETVFAKVAEILQLKITESDLLFYCLKRVWNSYDLGGHSVGRSLRSSLLEMLFKKLDQGNMEHARVILANLVSMYHDHEFITRNKWYDFELNFGLYGSSRDERQHLLAAAFLMEIQDQIPSVSELEAKDFYLMLQKLE